VHVTAKTALVHKETKNEAIKTQQIACITTVGQVL